MDQGTYGILAVTADKGLAGAYNPVSYTHLTDYFSTATGVPMGLSIEDGVYKSSPEGFGTIAVVDGAMEYISAPEITMTLTHDNTGRCV